MNTRPLICSVPDCGKRVHGHGLCRPHHYRAGAGLPPEGRNRPTPEERLWAVVDKGAPGGCWTWTGHVSTGGYGQFNVNRRLVSVHRFAYELLVGPIPEGLFIDHRCHNKRCVNPAHLRVVTNKQNVENYRGMLRNNSTGVRGVHWNKARRKYQGAVIHCGVKIHVGLFETLDEAADAVRSLRLKLFTHNDEDRGRSIGSAA